MPICQEEPCRSKRTECFRLRAKALEQQLKVDEACSRKKRLEAQIRSLLLLLAILFIFAVACSLIRFGPANLCDFLWIATGTVAAAIGMGIILSIGAVERMHSEIMQCLTRSSEYTKAREDLVQNCPEECWTQPWDHSCKCE